MSTHTNAPSAPPPNVGARHDRVVHTITGHFGATYKITTLGLQGLLERDALPEDLLDVAVREQFSVDGEAADMMDAAASLGRDEILQRLREFGSLQRHLAAAALVEPKMTADELAAMMDSGAVPPDDVAMIASIVLRRRDVDARGVKIGVAVLDLDEAFHEAHGIPVEGCEGCKAFVARLSSLGVGEV